MEHKNNGMSLGNATCVIREMFDARGIRYFAHGAYVTCVTDGKREVLEISDRLDGTFDVRFATPMDFSAVLLAALRNIPLTRVDKGMCTTCGEEVAPNVRYCPNCGAMIGNEE